MQQALGSRATLPAPLRAQARGASAARSVSLLVQCSKKVTKKAQVVLTQNVPNLGAEGLLTSVRLGYYRCEARPPRCTPRCVFVAVLTDAWAVQELSAARGHGQAGRRVHPGVDQGEARG